MNRDHQIQGNIARLAREILWEEQPDLIAEIEQYLMDQSNDEDDMPVLYQVTDQGFTLGT